MKDDLHTIALMATHLYTYWAQNSEQPFSYQQVAAEAHKLFRAVVDHANRQEQVK